MRRRPFLATTGALLAASLSGCAHPNAVLTMDDVTTEEIAQRASRDVSTNDEDRRIVADAVGNGTANATGNRPPLEVDEPVEYDGRYYNLTVTETGRRERTQYDIEIDYGSEESTPTGTPGDDTVAFDDLPEVDRWALDRLLPPRENPPRGEGYDFGYGRVYTDDEVAQSVLVPEQEYDAVVYDGVRYPIRIGDGRTVSVYDYRYEADVVAPNATAFGEQVRSKHLFTLSGLSEAERDLVERAIDGGYYEGQGDEAFRSLVSRFRDHPGIETHETGGEWLVEYRGTVYWADLRHSPSDA